MRVLVFMLALLGSNLFVEEKLSVSAFSFPSNRVTALRSNPVSIATSLSMAPRFDPSSETWYATSPDDEASAGYGPLGTLLRQGPKPLIIRLTNPQSYEQGVLKFMANENMDRMEAQGNFDAYLENPNDWAYQYTQEKNGAFKKDYVNDGMDPQSLALKAIWTAGILGLAYRGVYCYYNDVYFYEFLGLHPRG